MDIEIKMWDGSLDTLNQTNQDNFGAVQKLIDHLSTANNPLLPKTKVTFDLKLLPLLNRNARLQFLSNAKKLVTILPSLFYDFQWGGFNDDFDAVYQDPVYSDVLFFDKEMINTFWQAVAHDIEFMLKTMKKYD
ncbi:hypothetical protein ACI3E1_07675 [Ligilactobacillus sp. LYQ139]|uniref:hypothetical protein n=1 Tax=Ligilactobacillus sp. LYQ139 TaxID=3378800 RepID=UPI003852C490